MYSESKKETGPRTVCRSCNVRLCGPVASSEVLYINHDAGHLILEIQDQCLCICFL